MTACEASVPIAATPFDCRLKLKFLRRSDGRERLDSVDFDSFNLNTGVSVAVAESVLSVTL